MAKQKKKRSVPASILRVIGFILLAVVVLLAGLVAFLSITEYMPADREAVTPADPYGVSKKLGNGQTLSVVTWNVGYGALGDNADFFMDGGSSVISSTEWRVGENLAGMLGELRKAGPDIIFMQEADRGSNRSHNIDEAKYFLDNLPGYRMSFANNFKVSFLPYPIPPIGKVDSGLATYSSFAAEGSERVQLPIPFSWPMRMANLKRCVLIDRVPIEGSDKQLVLVNLHLEAYDDGEGKAAQTEMLRDILEKEAANGNYVIAGGDFNQIFSSADSAAYPTLEGNWQCSEIDVSAFPEGWQFLMDERVPSCRLLDRPYEGADKASFQYYLIDGFIVSPNVTVQSLETLDLGFACSDHNPVVLRVVLGGE
ncbi:MAG: endonuclease/exonuclease/phosphatase family protein [Clostridia bacterium]|nr:endonuclease/exonuclease/phosphatase family protein [Clostridia bacterium]MBQ2110524.1 endonuclease/exonuclease/phosphatase family protein [Clostridia bacterium]